MSVCRARCSALARAANWTTRRRPAGRRSIWAHVMGIDSASCLAAPGEQLLWRPWADFAFAGASQQQIIAGNPAKPKSRPNLFYVRRMDPMGAILSICARPNGAPRFFNAPPRWTLGRSLVAADGCSRVIASHGRSCSHQVACSRARPPKCQIAARLAAQPGEPSGRLQVALPANDVTFMRVDGRFLGVIIELARWRRSSGPRSVFLA